MAHQFDYDLIALGAGSGGLSVVERAASYGQRCAVVERGKMGGTCVNVGCVPKKVMWYTASHMHHFEHAAAYGYDVTVNNHDWAALKANRDAYVERLNGIYESNLDRSGVTYIAGIGRFVDEYTVAVGSEHAQAERIGKATG